MSPMTAPVAADAAGIVTLVFAVLAATSLSWYKTESRWLVELIRAVGGDSALGDCPEYQIDGREGAAGAKAEDSGWTLMPRSWTFTTTVAMAWLPVGTKALALVRQRA
ncbi:hypothetical protein BN1723_013747 [Verticillium longisporum]|uniref:Uncharacterized protein n=1 Tax=Verticillium longisporum TaxID=100787 RepID=A0A0G4MG73_VERLO|nr:hypothetical protein BN1723_013747 [Verticillium longisporum]CRK33237.1 hypothetical protein BN1708_016250 [Verticillium longisporum]